MGLPSDKPPAVSIPRFRERSTGQDPSRRGTPGTHRLSHPARSPRRRCCRDGVRVLRRESAIRRRLPPLRLPGVRAPSPPCTSLLIAVVLSRRVVSSLVSVDLVRRPRNPSGNGGMGAPKCVDLAADSLICRVKGCGSAHIFFIKKKPPRHLAHETS